MNPCSTRQLDRYRSDGTRRRKTHTLLPTVYHIPGRKTRSNPEGHCSLGLPSAKLSQTVSKVLASRFSRSSAASFWCVSPSGPTGTLVAEERLETPLLPRRPHWAPERHTVGPPMAPSFSSHYSLLLLSSLRVFVGKC